MAINVGEEGGRAVEALRAVGIGEGEGEGRRQRECRGANGDVSGGGAEGGVGLDVASRKKIRTGWRRGG